MKHIIHSICVYLILVAVYVGKPTAIKVNIYRKPTKKEAQYSFNTCSYNAHGSYAWKPTEVKANIYRQPTKTEEQTSVFVRKYH